MADLVPPTPFAEKLAAELRALHDKRERTALTESEEARYAELWAWWQSSGTSDDPAAEAPQASTGDAVGGLGEVPAEWLEAYADDPQPFATGEPPHASADAATPFAASDDELVREWQAWQTQRPESDPFAVMPGLVDAPEPPSEAELLAARSAELGDPDAGMMLGGDDAAQDELGGSADAAPGTDDAVDGVPTADAVRERADRGEVPDAPVASARPAAATRVVVHLLDGQVRRGTATDLDLDAERLQLTLSGGASEAIARADVRAVFFLRDAGEPPPKPAGDRVTVIFRDGRELAGTSADHGHLSEAFTLVPADARVNASLVWIARTAVRQIDVG